MKNINGQVKQYFDNTETYIVNNYIIELRAQIIKKYLGDLKGKSILDIGCGNGKLTSYYSNLNNITFIDISEEMIREARSNIKEDNLGNVKFICGDFLKTDIVGKYDVIVLVGVIAHLDDIEIAFSKLNALLSKNGKLIIQFTNCNHIISFFNFIKNKGFKNHYNYNLNRTSKKSIRSKLEGNGFKITKVIRYFPISPLFSVLRNKVKYKYLVKFHQYDFFANLGPENIYILELTN